MLGLEMLDVAIGMTFIFLMLSLICTAINEIIEAKLKKRAVDLERGIRELLQDESGEGLAKELYEHPLVFGLFKGEYNPENIKTKKVKLVDDSQNKEVKPEDNISSTTHKFKKTESPSKSITYKNYKLSSDLPSYIPSRNFALALMDIVLPVSDTSTNEANQPRSLQSLRIALQKMENEKVKKALLALTNDAGDDIDKARENIEAWYDSSMDRVSGWYKRRAQIIVIILGAIVAIGMNADTIAIYKSLTSDEPLRNSLIAAAPEYAKHQENDSNATAQQRIKENMDALAALGLPIGWNWKSCATPDAPRNFRAVPPWGWDWLFKIFGWLLTAVAISLGAPFWFDVLNKFMVIRSTVKPHEKSPEESSEDRQNRSDKGNRQTEAVLSDMEGMLKGFNAAVTPSNQKKFEALSEEEQHRVMAEAIDENEEKWKTIYSNVASLATGNKYTAGTITAIKCIVFYVKEKITDEKQLAQTDAIPDQVEYKGFKIPTDVQPQKDMPRGENFSPPPLDPTEIHNRMPGCGISRLDSEELGSLGMVVYREDKDGNRTHYLLSCFHVLCSSEFRNNLTEVSGNKFHGDPGVVCPSLFDDRNRASENIVADMSEGIITSFVDAAIAKIRHKDSISDLKGLKKPIEVYDLVAKDENKLTVCMRGRVSTPTSKVVKSGKVKHINSNPTILYIFPNNIVQRDMKRLIQTEKISDKGDSGGPVFTEDGKLIGIIVAGSSEYSYIIPIKHIMNRLDVRV